MTDTVDDLAASGISVSVITPCYNGARFLRATIESVLAQTQPALEMIVIDDGSTDESAAIAESFGPPVRVIRQRNQGESVARNKGIAEARGTHLFFLDADDLITPESLQRLAAALEGRPAAVAMQGCRHFETDTNRDLRVDPATRTAFYPAIIETNFGPPHCWLTPTALVRKAGAFYEPLHWFEDWDLWWRVGLHASDIVPVDYIGAQYRQHAKSQFATISMANRTRGHAIITQRMGEALLQRQDLLADHAEPLLWALWTALVRAVTNGVPWHEVAPLAGTLHQLSRSGHPRVSSTRLAKIVRWFGPRGAFTLHRLQQWSH